MSRFSRRTQNRRQALGSDYANQGESRGIASSLDQNETTPEYYERKGLEYFDLAMHSKNLSGFQKQIKEARSVYSRAASGYHARSSRSFELRCRVWETYLEFYLLSNYRAKRKVLDKAWSYARQSLDSFSNAGSHLEFAKTYDQLCTVVGLAFDFHWSPKIRGQMLKEGVEYGRQASKAVSPAEDGKLSARICARTALFIDAIGNEGSEIEHNDELDREGLEFWKKAEQIDKESALFQIGFPPGGFFRIVDEDESHRIHNEALEVAKKRQDNFAIGWLLSQKAGWTFFGAIKSAKLLDSIGDAMQSLQHAESAERHHELTNFVSPNCGLMWCVSPYAEHFLQLSWFQTEEKKRRLFVEKAWRETRSLLRSAVRSGYPQALAYADHVTSKILMDLAEYQSEPKSRMRVLRQALKHRVRAVGTTGRVQPNDIHRNGTYLVRLGEIKASIADLLKDRRSKIRLLSTAVNDKEKALRFTTKYATIVSRGQPHFLQRVVGVDLIVYGDLLMHLYKVAGDEKILMRAAKAYTDAVGFLKTGTAFRRLGEAYWKAGEVYDHLRANLAAAENFALAAKTYLTVAEKYPDLGPLYIDYSRYLEAWSNIEYARASHRRLAFEESKKFYDKAASLHQSAGRWSFLAPYYDGLGKLEAAENLSRNGDSAKAISAFNDAAHLFRESSVSLQKHATLMERPEEKAMIERMAAAFKEQYCVGRAMIEEARVAEDQGDYRTSTDKFDQASSTFENASKLVSLKRERDELLYISALSKAWKEMAQTAGSGSGQGFARAAVLFEKSLEYGPDETAMDVSMGHKYFCEALAASSQFTYTLDSAAYDTAVKYLTIASSHFSGAGFNVQSAHAQACKLLLDAHAEIAKSSKQPDFGESARRFEAAKNILQEAAEGFARAHQTAKQQQVLRLMDSVGQQLGLSQHLEEISKTTANISPTVAFPTPARGEEAPIGHSRFAGADIEARFTDSTSKDSIPGDDALVEIAIANTGSQPIRLLKIKDVIPYNARPRQGQYRTEGGSLLLDQRRVEPMKLETFQVKLHPKNKSPIIIRPSILFSDDNGRHLERELTPRILTASPILEFLTREFLADYRNVRLARDHCGWRTLTSVVKALKIPRSQVYGEARWGREYGRPLEPLVKSGLVESRTFPGERGRGGLILKIRLAYDSEIAKQYAEEMQA